MTPEQLIRIIGQGESLSVEFKGEEKAPLSDRDLIEHIVCLTNRPGDDPGWLIIGVERDGRITGARPRQESGITDPLRVQALIANNTRPPLSCRTEIVILENKPVLAIEVPASRTPVGTTGGLYLRRAIGGHGEPICLPLSYHEMHSMLSSRSLLDYSALIIPDATWDDLDPLEFERFRRSIRENPAQGDRSLIDLPDIELAKALGAVEANAKVTSVRNLGLLLFGREEALRRHIPTHEAAFQVLSGLQVRVNDFFRWPLLRIMEEFIGRFRARNTEQEFMFGLLRIGIPDYPERAFREALANALIHRDYTRLGAMHVQWHDDRIEISNPGGFPEGVHLNNILVTSPRPRNPLLADAFKRAGIVERTGRGIDTIYYEQLRNGRPAPSYSRSSETSVVLIFPGGKANQSFVRLVAEEDKSGHILSLEELYILNKLLFERRLTASEIARSIQKPESDARSSLEGLIERGLVEARGERRARTYHLSAATYRRLGTESSYVRQRGLEPLQQEQMILQYLGKYGRISRSQTAEMCQISVFKAGRLLKRVRSSGKIRLVGAGKTAHYELIRQV